MAHSVIREGWGRYKMRKGEGIWEGGEKEVKKVEGFAVTKNSYFRPWYGVTENAAGTLKTRDCKTRDWKTRDQDAGVENAGLENVRPSNRGWKTQDWKTRDLKIMESVTKYKISAVTMLRQGVFEQWFGWKKLRC